MTFNFSEHKTLVNRFVAELRNVELQKDRMRFRRNLERIGEVVAYEISKTLEYTVTDVETPLGIASVHLPTSRVVIASILRAGLPFHNGLLNYFDQADNAFISAYRMHHKDGSFEIKLEYVSCPDLTNCTLILADPMLATGASMDLAIKALQEYGQPTSLHLVTAIASTHGFNYIKRLHPQAHLWVGAVDDELTARSYIVPGLGDAGDLSFGTKLQD
ncbi:MAG: uracil phosphoribosyltransferase [Bacteroidota bacterium]